MFGIVPHPTEIIFYSEYFMRQLDLSGRHRCINAASLIFSKTQPTFLTNLNAHVRKEKGEDRHMRSNNMHKRFRRSHRHLAFNNTLSINYPMVTIIMMVVLILGMLIPVAISVPVSVLPARISQCKSGQSCNHQHCNKYHR